MTPTVILIGMALLSGCSTADKSTASLSSSCELAMKSAVVETQNGGFTDSAFNDTVRQCSTASEWIAGVQQYPAAAMFTESPTTAQAQQSLDLLCLSVSGPACGTSAVVTTQPVQTEQEKLADALSGLSVSFPADRWSATKCMGGVITFESDHTIDATSEFRSTCLAIPDGHFTLIGENRLKFAGDDGTWTMSTSVGSDRSESLFCLNRTGSKSIPACGEVVSGSLPSLQG